MTTADSRFLSVSTNVHQLLIEHPSLSEKVRGDLTKLVECLRRSSTGASEYQQQERTMLSDMLRDFEMTTSQPFLSFQERGWADLPVPNLVSIAELLAFHANIQLTRESKRRKPVLFKWLSEYWSQFSPWRSEIKLEFDGKGEEDA
jgi:hypothetical protein